jgi:predicted transcriptional regulator
MSTLKMGIASYKEMKSRTMAVARGTRRIAADEPKVWFIHLDGVIRQGTAGRQS